MKISIEDVEYIAHLARLNIHDRDKEHYADDMSNILGLVEQMNQQDSKGVEPMAHSLDTEQRQRDDVISESNQRDLFQKLAPTLKLAYTLSPKLSNNVLN